MGDKKIEKILNEIRVGWKLNDLNYVGSRMGVKRYSFTMVGEEE